MDVLYVGDFLLATILHDILVHLCTSYGTEFLHETYLYHITRKDHRHNFSIYFYQIYLSHENFLNAAWTLMRSLRSIMEFLPQFTLVLALGGVLARDLPFACFAQTFAFVMLNKVCTSQVSCDVVLHDGE